MPLVSFNTTRCFIMFSGTGVQNETRYFLMFSGAHKEQSGIKWQSVSEYRLWQTSIFKNYCHPVKYLHEILSISVASEIYNFHSDEQ